MNLTDFFWGLGDLYYWVFENSLDEDKGITNFFNSAILIFGFIAFGYWMMKQAKLNKQAASNPDQLK